jgi:hypothetical protein
MTAVMLGGIIGIYVFGLSENVQHMRVDATRLVQSGLDIVVTYQGDKLNLNGTHLLLLPTMRLPFIR